MKVNKVSVPINSILYKTPYRFADSYQAEYMDPNNAITLEEIGKTFFKSVPDWTSWLFTLRNRIVSIFGLKTPNQNIDRQELFRNFNCDENERLGLFKVFRKTENEVILGEDDKHLNFRISLLKEEGAIDSSHKKLTITTTVIFNNWFGKLYFLPVKPFHKLIVPLMLKGIVRQLANRNVAH